MAATMPQRSSATAPSGDGAKVRVAVAEGHPLLRLGTVRALHGDQRTTVVGEAEDGLAAIALARRLRPDVMLVELRMPALGGAILLERLRAEVPEVKVLVLSANESRDSLLEALGAGAAGYLSKRITPEQLREAVVATGRGESVISPELVGHLVSQFSAWSADGGSSARGTRLTAPELELVRLVAAGRTDREIAEELYLSRHSVQKHLTRIREKTGMSRRSAIARWAVDHALV
jgi:DNA-binding NarL/FixJ family response regulator